MLKIKQIEKLYKKIPKIECQKKCEQSCGIIPLTNVELKVIEARVGKIKCETVHCPLLKDDRCSIHDIRPLICRLWGVVDHDGMRCPHGCKVERMLTNKESYKIINKALEIAKGDLRFLNEEFVNKWEVLKVLNQSSNV